MKKYIPKKKNEDSILQLIQLGVTVVAYDGNIVSVEFDENIIDIKDIETITGLKFKESV